MKKDGVLLAGGGLDSTALLCWLASQRKDIEVMHVDYGQKAWYAELLAVQHFADKYDFLVKQVKCDLTQVGSSAILRDQPMATAHTDNKLEGRNVILIGLALTYAASRGMDTVFVGFHSEPEAAPFPDATKKFLDYMDTVAQFGYSPPMQLLAPFFGHTRLEIFKLGKTLDDEFEKRSRTCYEGRIGECGQCTHCLQKKEMVAACAE